MSWRHRDAKVEARHARRFGECPYQMMYIGGWDTGHYYASSEIIYRDDGTSHTFFSPIERDTARYLVAKGAERRL